jgi:large repetitive protein
VQPIPTTLNGASVTVGGYSAHLYFTSPTQLNIQIPWELAGQASASLTVTTANGTSTPVTINLASYAPALFSQNQQGTGPGLIYDGNGALNSSTNAANPGSIVVMAATNLGPAQIQQPDGMAPSGNLVPIANSISVTIGGTAANVVLAELCGGARFCPLPDSAYLIYVQVPNVSGAALPVVVTEGAVSSNSVTMNVAAQALTINSGPGFGDYQIGPVQLPLQASGGSGSGYTWAVTGGSLPTGLFVRNDGGPNYFPVGVTLGILGVATAAGTANFTLQVTDSASNTATLACTMNILSLAITDPNQLSDGLVGAAYSYTMTAAGNTGGVTWAIPNGNSLPAGLSLDGSTGEISGTPTSRGGYGFNLSATDSTGTTTRGYNISIFGVGFSGPADLGNYDQGSTVNLSLSGVGGTPPYSFSGCCLPPGLSLSQTGAITGTVTGGDGTFRFNVNVSDQAGHSFNKNFVINVIGTPTLPGIGVANPIEDASEGESRNFPLNVNGGQSPYTWSINGSLPPGMRLLTSNVPSNFNLGPDDAVITGSPTGGQFGNVFYVNVKDSSPTPITVSVPVTINVKPMAINYPLNPIRGLAYSGYIQEIGEPYPAPDEQWTILSGQMPPGLSLNSNTGTITGTPTADGNFGVFMQIQAATFTLGRYINFNIQSPTVPPISFNNLPALPDGTVNNNYNYTVSACCAPNGLAFSVVGSLPSGLNLSGNGQLSGTPHSAGPYTVTIKATDNNNSNNFGIGIYSLNITSFQVSTPTPPATVGVAYNTSFTVTSGNSGTVSWSALGPGSHPPPGLNWSNGTLSGTPASPGNFNMNSIVSDTGGNSFHVFFSINVYPAAAVPPPSMNFGNNFGTWSIGEVQFALNVSGGNGTYSWSIENGSLPTGLAIRTDPPQPSFFNGATAGISGVATTPGNYAFTIAVTSAGQTAYQYCTWKFSKLIVMDGGNLPPAFVGVPYSYTFTPLNAQGSVSWTLTNGSQPPPGLTFSGGVLSGTPTQAGNFNNTRYEMTDGIDPASRSFNLNVSAVRFTSSAILNNVPTNTAVNATFTAAGGSGGYTYSPGGLPCCLSLSSGGVLTGPLNGVGNFGFQVTVTDSTHESYTQEFSIDAVGDPPLLPSINLGPFSQDPVSFVGGYMSSVVSVSNGGTAPFAWTVSGLPPGVSYRPYNLSELTYMTPGQVEIWGEPTTAGSYPVTYKVTDANGLSASVTSTLTVSPIMVDYSNFPPNGAVGTAYSDKIRVLGGTGPYTITLVGAQISPLDNPLPDGLTLNANTFTISGTPLESGNFNPIFKVQDSQGNSFVMLTGFNISSGSPQININNYFYLGNATIGSAYDNQLNSCCTNSGQFTYSVAGGALPTGLNLSASGAINGTATTSGTYTFLVKASDSTSLSNAGYKQFVITATPIEVTASSNLPSGNVATPYNYAIPTSHTTGTVSFQLGQGLLPPGISMSSSGVLSGTPTAAGQFPFNVLISDSNGDAFVGYFNLSVMFATCSVSNGSSATINDVQAVINQALGVVSATYDVNGDGAVNIIDVRIVINAVLSLGCTA